MYFGLHFSYSNIDIEVSNSEILPRRIPIGKLESFDLSSDKTVSKVLIKLIKEDVAALNEMNMGSKQWKLDGGSFELYDNLGVYLYRHPCHASCSQVMYSDIEQFMVMSAVDHKFLDGEVDDHPCSHNNHYRLQPFFLDNFRLKCSFARKDDDEAKQLLTELQHVDDKIERNELGNVETEFYHPAKSPNNWNEDEWTTRLYVGLKKTFQVDAMCGVRSMRFYEVMEFLKISYLHEGCFLFRGRPDIIIQKKGVMISTGSGDRDDGSGSESSDNVESTIENPLLAEEST